MSTQATAQGRDPSHLIGDVQGTVAAVERGDWVQAGLGMANTAMSIVGLSTNPLSGFLSAGFSWAIQHVDFLREPFDALLGNPQAIQKMSGDWASAARQIEQIAADYRRTSVEETRNWRGRSADGYRAAAQKHASGLATLSKAATGISQAAKGAGELVAQVRKTIMDLLNKAVSDMVMKIIQWLSVSWLTFGASIAAAIADIIQLAVDYAKKLVDFLQKLANSLKRLIDLIKQVVRIIQTAKQILQAITAMTHSNKGGGAGGAGSRPSAGGLGLTEGQLDGMDRGANDRYTSGSGGGTHTSGAVGGGSGGPHVSRPPTVGGHPTDGGWGGSGGSVGYPPPGSGSSVRRPPQVGGGSGGGGGGRGGGASSGGHWEPGRWVPAASGPGATPLPAGTTGPRDTTYATNTTTPYVPSGRPFATPDLPTASGGGGGGGFGGGGGGFAGGGGVGGGGGGGAFGGGGAGGPGQTLQSGGTSGVAPQGVPGGAAGGHGGAAGGGRAGGMGGGMMGGMMPPMAGQGGQGDGKDHQRKVRLEGEPLVDEPPKAAKPIIGE